MKKIIFMFFILISSIGYSKTYWDGKDYDKSLVVLYKVLDPLIVKVDEPKRIIIPAKKNTYKYSEYSEDHRKLKVDVSTSYNQNEIDDILRKVYENVYFKLQNNGEFELNRVKKENEKAENIVIKGKGYFVDNSASAIEQDKKTQITKPFSSNVAGNKFSATTEIDAEFTVDNDNIPMGVYKGTLKLDVWFGGSIKQ